MQANSLHKVFCATTVGFLVNYKKLVCVYKYVSGYSPIDGSHSYNELTIIKFFMTIDRTWILQCNII